jgi:hypothetical protein
MGGKKPGGWGGSSWVTEIAKLHATPLYNKSTGARWACCVVGWSEAMFIIVFPGSLMDYISMDRIGSSLLRCCVFLLGYEGVYRECLLGA